MSKLMDWVMNTISDDDDLDEIEEQKEQIPVTEGVQHGKEFF